MSSISSTVSLQTLDLILEDISAEINLAINALDSFGRDIQAPKKLAKSLQHLTKCRGIFELLEMPAASLLVQDCIKIVKKLKKLQSLEKNKYLELLSTSLVGLIRYVEYVNLKNTALPELLLPTINYIREVVNAPLIAESHFFKVDPNLPRPEKLISSLISEEVAAKSRHYRQQYQIGLIEVLRQTNITGGLKMMQKSMHKLDLECARARCPNLWWIAQVMMDGFIEQKIRLTPNRLRLFSKIDRQIRNLENRPLNRTSDAKKEMLQLATEMLYLASISHADSKQWQLLSKHFDLQASTLSEQAILEQQQDLKGPTERDYHSIAEALIEETGKIEKSMLNISTNEFNARSYQAVLKQMTGLQNLLKILQVEEQVMRLSVAIDLIENSLQQKQMLSEKDTNILFLVLKNIASAVSESKLARYSKGESQGRARISEAKLKICEKTEAAVKQLIQGFGLLNLQGDTAITADELKPLKQSLNEITLGFKQLNVLKALPILDACQSFLEHHFVHVISNQHEQTVEYFADIVSSFEFYLETLKFTADPSARIFEFAEASMNQLESLTVE
jgi:hypothetical protein